MGKYSKVVKNLPALDNNTPDRRAKLEDLKSRSADTTPSQHASALVVLRQQKSKIEKELSELQLNLDACSELLSETFEAAGITNMKLDTGHTVFLEMVPYAQVEDRAANLLWAEDNGFRSLLQLHFQTLNALTKEALLAGEPEPDGVSVRVRTTVKVRKG
jgi:hypothetical protein